MGLGVVPRLHLATTQNRAEMGQGDLRKAGVMRFGFYEEHQSSEKFGALHAGGMEGCRWEGISLITVCAGYL